MFGKDERGKNVEKKRNWAKNVHRSKTKMKPPTLREIHSGLTFKKDRKICKFYVEKMSHFLKKRTLHIRNVTYVGRLTFFFEFESQNLWEPTDKKTVPIFEKQINRKNRKFEKKIYVYRFENTLPKFPASYFCLILLSNWKAKLNKKYEAGNSGRVSFFLFNTTAYFELIVSIWTRCDCIQNVPQ